MIDFFQGKLLKFETTGGLFPPSGMEKSGTPWLAPLMSDHTLCLVSLCRSWNLCFKLLHHKVIIL